MTQGLKLAFVSATGKNFPQLLSTASRTFGKHNAVLSSATLLCTEAASRVVFSNNTKFRFHALVAVSANPITLSQKTKHVFSLLHIARFSALFIALICNHSISKRF